MSRFFSQHGAGSDRGGAIAQCPPMAVNPIKTITGRQGYAFSRPIFDWNQATDDAHARHRPASVGGGCGLVWAVGSARRVAAYLRGTHPASERYH
ncbi:protein of unknown function [Pseudomonas sp. JV551A1]|nr:protein of unknown function [Pseudomonas sp. JV551A1]